MPPRRGRPPTPLNPGASKRARLGAELRDQREAAGLTLEDLATIIGYSPQRISDVERAKATPSRPFVIACEDALHADAKLLPLLPDAQRERDMARQERADARRDARQAQVAPALACEVESDAGDDDQAVEPTDRRGLLEAGAAAALGIPLLAASTQARAVDPELPAHSARLLDQLGRLDAALGPQDLLPTVRYEVARIVAHRRSVAGELRTDLLRVEAQWAGFAAWLCSDTGQTRDRDAWAERALRLAREASYPDMIAFVRSRQSQGALQDLDERRATRFVEDTHISGGSAQSRALCACYAALGHALAGSAAACERSLADARSLAERSDSPAPPWAGGFRLGDVYLLTTEARCWLWLEPSKAIPLYDSVLRGWPRKRMRTGGLHQARLALACANAGELDRAEVEGRKALAVQHATRSTLAARELRSLGEVLKAA